MNYNNFQFLILFIYNMTWYKSIKSKSELIQIFNKNFSNKLIKNTNIILDSNKEIKKSKYPRKFYTIKVDTADKIDLLANYLIFYHLLAQYKSDNLIMSIDFEFNSKIIALMQICFEWDHNKILIFVFYPPDLNKIQTNNLIKLLVHDNIIKILHGAEALDIPYLFEELLKEPELISNFLNKMIDTRFFCEYYNYINKFTERKCKIYFLLKDFKVITQKKIEQLEIVGKKMGNISDIIIDVQNMSDALLHYSLYDVLFLKDLYLTFPLQDEFYKSIIPEFTKLAYLTNRNIIPKIKNLALKINQVNNYFTTINNKRKTLIALYKEEYMKLSTNILILLGENVRFFKKIIILLLKYFIYQKFLTKNVFYINRDNIYKNQFDKSDIEILNQFPNIKKIFTFLF